MKRIILGLSLTMALGWTVAVPGAELDRGAGGSWNLHEPHPQGDHRASNAEWVTLAGCPEAVRQRIDPVAVRELPTKPVVLEPRELFDANAWVMQLNDEHDGLPRSGGQTFSHHLCVGDELVLALNRQHDGLEGRARTTPLATFATPGLPGRATGGLTASFGRVNAGLSTSSRSLNREDGGLPLAVLGEVVILLDRAHWPTITPQVLIQALFTLTVSTEFQRLSAWPVSEDSESDGKLDAVAAAWVRQVRVQQGREFIRRAAASVARLSSFLAWLLSADAAQGFGSRPAKGAAYSPQTASSTDEPFAELLPFLLSSEPNAMDDSGGSRFLPHWNCIYPDPTTRIGLRSLETGAPGQDIPQYGFY